MQAAVVGIPDGNRDYQAQQQRTQKRLVETHITVLDLLPQTNHLKPEDAVPKAVAEGANQHQLHTAENEQGRPRIIGEESVADKQRDAPVDHDCADAARHGRERARARFWEAETLPGPLVWC